MKEPTFFRIGGQECRPLSTAPFDVLQGAASGALRFIPDEDVKDEAFVRQYAAKLLKERGQ